MVVSSSTLGMTRASAASTVSMLSMSLWMASRIRGYCTFTTPLDRRRASPDRLGRSTQPRSAPRRTSRTGPATWSRDPPPEPRPSRRTTWVGRGCPTATSPARPAAMPPSMVARRIRPDAMRSFFMVRTAYAPQPVGGGTSSGGRSSRSNAMEGFAHSAGFRAPDARGSHLEPGLAPEDVR